MKKDFNAPDRLAHVPQPIYDDQPELTEFYYTAWKLANDHVKYIPGMPQNPYMDEAFCHTQIWIWDSCFMSMFCKFAQNVFPGIETFRNFLDVMYCGAKLPQVTVPDNEPRWTGWKPGEQGTIRIHIADNPPLFAWAEYENALISGDIEHVKTLLLQDQSLQKHYEFMEHLQGEPADNPDWLQNRSCGWIAREQGFSWEGGRSGMDNTPRGRTPETATRERPSTPDLLWIDAISQQALAARCIGKLFKLIHDDKQAAEWEAKAEAKAELIRTLYWDDEDGMFYDRSIATGKLNKVPTIASFWPMVLNAATKEQAAALADKMTKEQWFGGKYPFVSVARKDPDFKPVGGDYWRGGIWLPTSYATLRGLLNYGYIDLARDCAKKLLEQQYRTWRDVEPHTIWECYAPNSDNPGLNTKGTGIVRKDFCGWSALGPISIFIENIIGFYKIDAFENKVWWALDKSLTKKVGIRHLKFGDTDCTITAEKGVVTTETNRPFTLDINGTSYSVQPGTMTWTL